MTTIVQKDNPVLREKSREISPDEIGTDAIQNIIARMKDAVHSQDDGVAIAAPQIGELVRIFVIAGRTFALINDEEPETTQHDDLVCINPRIVKRSKDTVWMDEGCLSVRWKYGQVKRHSKATIEALDEHGERFQRGGSGLMAQIFQHEIDHLDGILFTDKARNVREETPAQSEDSAV